MNPALVYCCPLDDDKTFIPCAIRWAESYRKFDHGHPHDLVIVFCNGRIEKHHYKIFEGIKYKEKHFNGGGWDCGAYIDTSHYLTQYEFAVFQNARTFYWRDGWLKRLMEAREQNFDPNGLYGMSASYEKCPWKNAKNFLGPHIRSAAFGTRPATFNKYPYLINSRDKGFLFESGAWNFSNFYSDSGYKVLMVCWDGAYERQDWRKPANVFRKGDQSNLLVCDRHTEMYRVASPQEKLRLTRLADGRPIPSDL